MAAGAGDIWAEWMSAGFLSSWLAPGLGCREQLGSSRASLALIPIPSPLTLTLCFSKIFPPEASLVAQMIKNLPAMWETQLGWEDLLEEGMTIHSSVLAWEILGIEEPSGLQSVGLQRVGHDCAANTLMFLPQSFKSFVNVFPSSPHFNSFHVKLPSHYLVSAYPLFAAGTQSQTRGELVSQLGTVFVLRGQLGVSEQVVGCHQ